MSKSRWLSVRPDGTRPKAPRQKPESIQQKHIITMTKTLGGKAYVLGTKRKATDHQGTMQTPGIADLWVVLPTQMKAGLDGLGLWWEVKAPGNRRSPEQEEFGDWCRATGTPYGWGTYDDFLSWLIARGYLSRSRIPHYAGHGRYDTDVVIDS